MTYLRDVLLRTRGPSPEYVKSVREESIKANLRAGDRLVETMKELIDKHNAARGMDFDERS